MKMKIGEPAGGESFMKSESLTKMLIHDDEGAAIAYVRDGIVYDVVSGARIAKLQAGQSIHSTGSSSEHACLRERFAEREGKPAAFLKLFRRE